MPSCPICSTDSPTKYKETPYFVCPNCACWHQSPMPPKVWHGEHEPPPETMPDHDKAVNEQLAGWLFNNVMHGKPGPTLDVGAAYPYLASRLKARGCQAIASDGDRSIIGFGVDLGVMAVQCDIENDDWPVSNDRYSLITLIHTYEHTYYPLAVMRKLRRLVADDGRVFLRLPQHNITGFERDLTNGHYSIHPFYHCATSILECCVQTDTFTLEQYMPIHSAGQADIVLRPL